MLTLFVISLLVFIVLTPSVYRFVRPVQHATILLPPPMIGVSDPPICLSCGGTVIKAKPQHEVGVCEDCKSLNFIEIHLSSGVSNVE